MAALGILVIAKLYCGHDESAACSCDIDDDSVVDGAGDAVECVDGAVGAGVSDMPECWVSVGYF